MGSPVFRIMVKNKATGVSKEVAVVWPSKFEGLYNVQFHKDGDDDRKTDLRSLDLESHYVNMLPVRPGGKRRKPRDDEF